MTDGGGVDVGWVGTCIEHTDQTRVPSCDMEQREDGVDRVSDKEK